MGRVASCESVSLVLFVFGKKLWEMRDLKMWVKPVERGNERRCERREIIIVVFKCQFEFELK